MAALFVIETLFLKILYTNTENYYSAAIKVPKIRIRDRLLILLAQCLASLRERHSLTSWLEIIWKKTRSRAFYAFLAETALLGH